MTPERAKELIKLWHFNEAGCLTLGAKKPDLEPMTADESLEGIEFWDNLSNSDVTWFDALTKIANGEAEEG